MQSEFAASAIAWGFSTFSKSKCVVKTFSSAHSESLLERNGNISELEVYECTSNDCIIISQGFPFEIGLEFSPSHSYAGGLEDFIASFDEHKELLKIELQIQLNDSEVLPRETADVQKHLNTQQEGCHAECTTFQRKLSGFYIGIDIPL